MQMSEPCCVITTINNPTDQMFQWGSKFHDRTIVIGDRKTPENWRCGDTNFFSMMDQKNLQLESISYTPENHYARKNIGYILAMRRNPSAIFDTDDDNDPAVTWKLRTLDCEAEIVSEKGWCNVYRYFTGAHIWPRGFPLNHLIFRGAAASNNRKEKISSPIQQLLANGNPDVDAIWRMTASREVNFSNPWSVALGSGVFCPFNSQATWWFPEAYPLMYLPTHATFRMTDIWRSFVAQRCLWAMRKKVTFHSPAEVWQDRNPHCLMDDFKSELPGFLHNEAIAKELEKAKLRRGKKYTLDNLKTCYRVMVASGFLPGDEIKCVDAWIEDVKNIGIK